MPAAPAAAAAPRPRPTTAPHPRLEDALSLTDSGAGSGSGPYSGSATVTGKVWLDNNGDGSIDNNEMDYSGATVNLFVSTNGGSTWSFKSSTTTNNATQGYNYSLPVAYGYPWPSSYIYKIQVGIPSYFYATTPGTSQIDAQGYSQTFGLSPGGTVYVTGGLCSMNDSTLNDDPNGPTQQNTVTLRDAIETGNNGGGIGHGSYIEPVTFINPSNGYALSGTIDLGAALPAIEKSYNIDGPGAAALAVSGNGKAGTIYVVQAGGATTISGQTITGGSGVNGGGILNKGNLTLKTDIIKGNTATGGGGGLYSSGGTVYITGGSITGNTVPSPNAGGGVYNLGSMRLLGVQVQGNSAGTGGGIYTNGNLVLGKNTTISGNNKASSNGAGIAVYGGTVAMVGGGITNNTAQLGGGGIYVNKGQLILSSGVLVSGNTAVGSNGSNGYGGGIYMYGTTGGGGGKVTVSGGTISNNTAAAKKGGGIFVLGGTLTLQDNVVITDNKANTQGGGCYLAGFTTTTFNDVIVSGNETNGSQKTTGWGVYEQNNADVIGLPEGLTDEDDPGGNPVPGP